MNLIVQYLQQDVFSDDKEKARQIKKVSARYIIMNNKLFKMGRAFPMLRCVLEDGVNLVMKEVHEGVCGNHLGGRSLASKILGVDYYWPTMLKDCVHFVNSCLKCQAFTR